MYFYKHNFFLKFMINYEKISNRGNPLFYLAYGNSLKFFYRITYNRETSKFFKL